MKKYNLKDYVRGWLVGDFEPSILKTKDFEFMVHYYIKGEKEAKHLHKLADEITVIVSGEFKMSGEKLFKGDVIHLIPNTAVDFECLEDGATAVVKTPSVKGDKYIV